MSSVFEGFLTTPALADAFGGRSFVQAMLRFEAALASAQAEVGLIPASAAASIANTCKVELFDVEKLVRESGAAGSVAIPLIKALRDNVALFNPDAAKFVHLGSTSQDVIDTALVLVTGDALGVIVQDTATMIRALFAHARAHAATPILARTLMQPASVTSFGWKCVNWVAPLARCHLALADLAPYALQVQLGGAVGTLRELAPHGLAVKQGVARRLGLSTTHLTAQAWHTQRDTWVRLGCELGILAGVLGKIAIDIALMAQFEIAEVAEPQAAGRGGSSAMPHKQNPVGAMVALAAATRAPQRVAALLAAMPQAHERALGAWQAELAEWPGLITTVQGASHALAQVLPDLQIHPTRMRQNLETLRNALPEEARQSWFSAEFASELAESVRSEVARMEALVPPSAAR